MCVSTHASTLEAQSARMAAPMSSIASAAAGIARKHWQLDVVSPGQYNQAWTSARFVRMCQTAHVPRGETAQGAKMP